MKNTKPKLRCYACSKGRTFLCVGVFQHGTDNYNININLPT